MFSLCGVMHPSVGCLSFHITLSSVGLSIDVCLPLKTRECKTNRQQLHSNAQLGASPWSDSVGEGVIKVCTSFP